MIVIISGFAGCGKSTLARNLGKKLGLKVIHASGILKELKEKRIEEIEAEEAEHGTGFWESKQGQELIKKRLSDGKLDRELDKKLLEIIEKDNAVLDSLVMGYLSKKGLKIWVEASLETRAKRVALRSKISFSEAKKILSERDETNKKIYKKLYGFDLGKDVGKHFHLILNNEKISAKQTMKKALDFLQKEAL